jgi:transposase InsO family protein
VSEPFAFWVFLVILFGAAAVIWAITGRVARRDDDLAADERGLEADWISDTIGRWGGDVPVPVVTQVLDLHRRYLGGPGFDLESADDGEARSEGR